MVEGAPGLNAVFKMGSDKRVEKNFESCTVNK